MVAEQEEADFIYSVLCTDVVYHIFHRLSNCPENKSTVLAPIIDDPERK